MNYKQLIEDSNKGYIDWDVVQLVMDNDDGYWVVDTGDEERDGHLADAMEDKYGVPNGYRDIVAVLNAAGINCEWYQYE